jgi:hypothetical protein
MKHGVREQGVPMNRSLRLVSCAACLLMSAMTGFAQQRLELLSFELGGRKACAKAVGFDIPRGEDGAPAARTFTIACAERDMKIEEAGFANFGRLMARKGPKEARALHSLMDAFDTYRASYLKVEGDECGGGIGCGADHAYNEALMGYRLLVMLEGFRKEGLPHFSADDLAEADASLNAWYKKAHDHASDDCNSDDNACQSTAKDTFRDSQRAWLRYRDAWVTLGTLVWPQVSGDSWRCYLTRERLKGGWEGPN